MERSSRSIGIAVTCLLAHSVAAQSSCPNLGFEDGTLSNWTGGIGNCCPINVSGVAIVAGRHTIMTGPGTDPNTNGAVPVVAPGGGTYSVRLGNANSGSQAERLSYTMLVDPLNTLFVYRYAVVFEDPNHSANDQPRFEINMFDQNNLPISCGQYNVYSTAGIPGFVSIVNQYGEDVNYQNWTAVGMDLTTYIGQTVTIEFATGDCALGAHYGYAYIDAYCSSLQIASDFCPGSTTTVLSAPDGFESYLWSTGDTTSSITVNNPIIGQVFDCLLTSFTGCTVSISTSLTPVNIAASFSYSGDCMNQVQFSDGSQVMSGPPLSGWWWDFGDGTTSTDQNPFHAFATPGPYTVTMAAYSSINCPDTAIQSVQFLESPIPDFAAPTACTGDPALFEDLTPIVNTVDSLAWDFGDGSTSNAGIVAHTYAAGGTYDVGLYVSDINGCWDTLSLQVVVEDYPVMVPDADTVLCEGFGPVILDADDPTASILWSTGATTQTISVDSSGVFTVQASSPLGCAVHDTVQVVFNPLPDLPLVDSLACMDQPMILDAGNPGSTYLWNTSATTQTIQVNTIGTYSVTITTPFGCVGSQSVDIDLFPVITVDLGPDVFICYGEPALLDAGTFINSNYIWNTSAVTSAISTYTAGTYWVAVSNPGCSGADTIDVIVQPLPVIDLQDTTLCVEMDVTYDAGNPGASYLWSTGATAQTITIGQQSGVYGVIVTLPTGCVDSSSAVVTFIPSIVLDLGVDTVVCDGEVLQLDATGPNSTYLWSTGSTASTVLITQTDTVSVEVTNGYCNGSDSIAMVFVPYPLHVERTLYDACFEAPGTEMVLSAQDAATYIWSTGDTTQSIVITSHGIYEVVATVPPGCSTPDIITVREYCDPRVYVPNTFTPDGDGTNEVFAPVGYNVRFERFMIFDRWGTMIHDNERGGGWDGTISGQQTPIGVFNWRVAYRPYLDNEGTLGAVQEITGHVTLVR